MSCGLISPRASISTAFAPIRAAASTPFLNGSRKLANCTPIVTGRTMIFLAEPVECAGSVIVAELLVLRRLGSLPAGGPLLRQLVDQFAIRRIVGQIGVFLRVDLMIVELDGFELIVVVALDPAREVVAVGAHRVAHQVLAARVARILAERSRLPGSRGIVKQRREARAFEMLRRR